MTPAKRAGHPGISCHQWAARDRLRAHSSPQAHRISRHRPNFFLGVDRVGGTDRAAGRSIGRAQGCRRARRHPSRATSRSAARSPSAPRPPCRPPRPAVRFSAMPPWRSQTGRRTRSRRGAAGRLPSPSSPVSRPTKPPPNRTPRGVQTPTGALGTGRHHRTGQRKSRQPKLPLCQSAGVPPSGHAIARSPRNRRPELERATRRLRISSRGVGVWSLLISGLSAQQCILENQGVASSRLIAPEFRFFKANPQRTEDTSSQQV